MKKSAIFALTGVLVLAFFMINVGSASAFRITTPTLPDPIATFVQGNPQFKAEVIPTTQLAGVDTLADGMLVPSGFPKGEKQFEGKALDLSGLSKTTVNLCFPLKGTSSGWGGQVGYWDGISWKLLATTITPAPESSLSWACAQGNTNGRYALIKWIVDSSLLPKTIKPACSFTIDLFGPVVSGDPVRGDGHVVIPDVVTYAFISSEDLTGRNVKITFLGSDPIGSVTINGHSSNFVIANGTIEGSEGPGLEQIDTVAPLEIDSYFDRNFDKYYFDFDDCALTLTIERAK